VRLLKHLGLRDGRNAISSLLWEKLAFHVYVEDIPHGIQRSMEETLSIGATIRVNESLIFLLVLHTYKIDSSLYRSRNILPKMTRLFECRSNTDYSEMQIAYI